MPHLASVVPLRHHLFFWKNHHGQNPPLGPKRESFIWDYALQQSPFLGTNNPFSTEGRSKPEFSQNLDLGLSEGQ